MKCEHHQNSAEIRVGTICYSLKSKCSIETSSAQII